MLALSPNPVAVTKSENGLRVFRAATLDRNISGKDLKSLTVDMRTSVGKPNLEKLRAMCLDSSLVIDAGKLELVGVLGEGAFGIVWKCAINANHFQSVNAVGYVRDGDGSVALKRMKFQKAPPGTTREKRDSVDTRSVASFSNELLMLKSLSHPNVVGYIGCVVFDEVGNENVASDTIAIVQEFAPYGTLKPLINSDSSVSCPFSTADGLRWAHHVALGMAYLHACRPKIVHRDLKPENVLLCGPRCVAKLADFGLMAFGEGRSSHDESQMAPYKRMTGKVGSMRYMGPENYRGDDYDHKTDIYSFAIILYELLVRKPAFRERFLSVPQIAELAATKDLRPAVPAKWPAAATKLLERCWAPTPASRPEFVDIANELAAWRNDEGDEVLNQITRSSPRTIAERFGQYKFWGAPFAVRVTRRRADRRSTSIKRVSTAPGMEEKAHMQNAVLNRQHSNAKREKPAAADDPSKMPGL